MDYTWQYIGNAGFSENRAENTTLAFSPADGQPYVAYMDDANSKKASVMFYNAPAGINDPLASNVLLYPNPANDIITIETSVQTMGNILSVLNVEGQELLTLQITEPKTQLDISKLPGGVYIVKLTSDNTVYAGKIIKQ